MSSVVLAYDGFANGGEFFAEIRRGDGIELWWTDGVVNEWSEGYPSVALAVLRLGVLIAAATEDRFFSLDAERFTRSAMNLGGVLAGFIEDNLD